MLDERRCPRCGMPTRAEVHECERCGADMSKPMHLSASGDASAFDRGVTTATATPSPTANVHGDTHRSGTPRVPAPPSYHGHHGYGNGSEWNHFSPPPPWAGAAAMPRHAHGYRYPPYIYPPYYRPSGYTPLYRAPRVREPGEVYRLVVSWIVLVLGALSFLCGTVLLVLAALGVGLGMGGSLATLTSLADFSIAPFIGGIAALYYGLTGLLNMHSSRVSLPRPSFFVILTALALGAGVVLWDLRRSPGPALAVLPLAVLAGILPALAILAFCASRLRLPSSRRHLWMSLAYGGTLAPLIAILLELFLTLVVSLIFGALGIQSNSGVANLNSVPTSPADIAFMLAVVSVIAPLVEEGLKPLGAVLIMRRLHTPAEAFLLGLAGGIGFDMFETIGYIGSGEADWVSVAIERLGAGLLHGVGAGMAALGWYYLMNGKGVRLRWLRGISAIAYAVVQHGFFNGSSLLGTIPGTFGKLFSSPVPWVGVPLQTGDALYFLYYALLLALLTYITGRLRHASQCQDSGDRSGNGPSLALTTDSGSDPLAGGAQ